MVVRNLNAYAAYLFYLTGSWTAWYDAQAAGWARTFTLLMVGTFGFPVM